MAGNTSDQDDLPAEDDQTHQAAACFGLQIIEDDSPDPQEPTEPSEPDICEVWPENWQALLLYLQCQSQREVSLGGMGGMGGVHYSPARSVNVKQELHWLNVPKQNHADTVHKFRTIEAEVLHILNVRANRKD
jgi:hypothetical protein